MEAFTLTQRPPPHRDFWRRIQLFSGSCVATPITIRLYLRSSQNGRLHDFKYLKIWSQDLHGNVRYCRNRGREGKSRHFCFMSALILQIPPRFLFACTFQRGRGIRIKDVDFPAAETGWDSAAAEYQPVWSVINIICCIVDFYRIRAVWGTARVYTAMGFNMSSLTWYFKLIWKAACFRTVLGHVIITMCW